MTETHNEMVGEIRKYNSIDTFFDDCKALLMKKECENNVILGMCNSFLTKSFDPEKIMLIAATGKHGNIISCALVTPNKTSLATFIKQIDIAVQPLANYFNHNQINLKGVSGEIDVIHSFIEVYQKPITKLTTLLLHKMENLQKIEIVQNTELTLATAQDIPILIKWLKNFQIDAGLLPSKPEEELKAIIEDLIKKKVLYKLVVSEDQQPVSMLAIVRETENFSIISWVYTPPNSRAKGFATTAVYKLTELMLGTHEKQCALFTDKANPISNRIYQNIGYQPVSEYLDIIF